MRNVLSWIWHRGVVSTFLSGLLLILPIVVTLWIINWVVEYLKGILGPGSTIGKLVQDTALRFVADPTMAIVLGWTVVLASIWGLGLLVKWTARYPLVDWFHQTMKRIPLVRSVYGPVLQVTSIFAQKEEAELAAMSVVYCRFGENEASGILALLASHNMFRFDERDCYLIYIPTSPVPMTGCLLFLPCEAVKKVNMKVDQLMQLYLSLGVLAPETIPQLFQVPRKAM